MALSQKTAHLPGGEVYLGMTTMILPSQDPYSLKKEAESLQVMRLQHVRHRRARVHRES